MGITQQFIKLLGADEKEMEAIIDAMDEKMAKQMLKVIMKEVHFCTSSSSSCGQGLSQG